MKQARDRMRNRLRILALMVLAFVGITAFCAPGVEGKIFVCAVTVAMALPVTISDEDKALAEAMLAEAKKEAEGIFNKYASSTMTIDKFNEKVADIEKKYADKVEKKELDDLTEKVKEQGLLIQKLKEGGIPDNEQGSKSLASILAETYVKNLDKIKDQKGVKGMQAFNMDVKSATTMTRANGTGSDTIITTELEPGLTRIVSRKPFLRDIMNVSGTTAQYIKYTEQANRDGAAGETGEGLVKNRIDFDMVVTSAEVKKITAFIKVSEEMIEDIDYIQGEINSELIEQINLKFDSQLFSGTGLTIYLKGITAFITSEMSVSGTPFESSVVACNRLDVLRAAVAIINANQFTPTYILLHPYDAAGMELEKDDGGQYVLPSFVGQNGKQIAGVPIIENTGITAGTFIAGDFTKCYLRIRKDATLKVGYDADDFTKNLVTILAELRACHYIKTNHVNAFARGTFSTLISAMTQALN